MSTNTFSAGDSLFLIQEGNRDIAQALSRAAARFFGRITKPRDTAFLSGPSFADQTPSMVREYICLGRYE